MNVVIVTDYGYVNGGAAQVALASARGLAESGHHVALFSAVAGQAPVPAHPNLRTFCTDQEEIAADPNRVRACVQGLWNRRAQLQMRRLLATLDPAETIVHFHGWTKALSSSVIQETLSCGFRSVTTLHEYFSACPNGGFFDYQRNASCSLKPMGMACMRTHCDSRSYVHKLWRVGRQVVQRSIAGFPCRSRHFITVSGFSESILRPYLPQAARLHAIPNPIAVPAGTPADPGHAAGFVYVGRLSLEKGPLLLARAAAGAAFQTSFIGDGPQRNAIQDLHPTAEMAGWLPADQVRNRMQRCRALVVPSLCYETRGLVVEEAAALGIPAIVPDHCAAQETVEDGVTGLVFRKGDAAHLRDRMSLLHSRPDLAASMGAESFRRYWSAPLTLQRHVLALEKVYRRILDEPRIPEGERSPMDE